MLNKVELIGNLCANPIVRRPSETRKAAHVNLATHRRWKDKDGNPQEETQWHPLVVWGPQAELAERLLKKGQLVYVEGRLNHTSWTDDEDRAHRRTEVVGQTFLILSPKAEPTEDASPAAEDQL